MAASLPPMGERARMCVVVPVYNEADSIGATLRSLCDQSDASGPLDPGLYEIVIVDNGSTDATRDIVGSFAATRPEQAVHVIHEPERGVARARRTGMELAVERSLARDREHGADAPFYLVSADADCLVDRCWLAELLRGMDSAEAALGVCDYDYSSEAFARRPRLWSAIERTLRCRRAVWPVFGAFPDGKGFAVEREVYRRTGGIEISYQLKGGRFLPHPSDDWDFGIRTRVGGHEPVYLPASRVEINPRRVDHALDEVIVGRAYGSGGTITMRDIREPAGTARERDLTADEARLAWEFSIKDFTPKNVILPLMLAPSLAGEDRVRAFLTPSLARRLADRAEEMREEMRLIDFLPIHSYKTPSYRLYFEFADEIFERLRATAGPGIGTPPPLPECLESIPKSRFLEFVRYFSEDRESGEAHDYFGNGGVF